MDVIQRFDLDCGATLLVEHNDAVQSAGLTWMIPVGSAVDPANSQGMSTLLAEWMWRGTTDLSSRAYTDALDRLGIDRRGAVDLYHLRIQSTMLASNVLDALPLLSDLVMKPAYPNADFEPIRDLSLQGLEGLADDPQQRAMLLLKDKHFPTPFNRSGYGNAEHLRAATPDAVRDFWDQYANPRGSIIAISGNVDPQPIADLLNSRLANWTGNKDEPIASPPQKREMHAVKEDTAQVHIGLAFDALPEPHPSSMAQRIAISALSGGMSGRLMTEIREKRSLCYSVHAAYAAGRDRGAVLAYAGTTPDRAQETLDVLIYELSRIREGIDQSEFQRAVVGLKSSLVMHGESSPARSVAIGADTFIYGKPRTLSEMAKRVDAVTLDEVNMFLASQPVPECTAVTLGPNNLTLNSN